MVYAGVDLHRKSSHVAVLAAGGELLASRRIASRPQKFLRIFGELEAAPIEVAFEATDGWGWFADLRSAAASRNRASSIPATSCSWAIAEAWSGWEKIVRTTAATASWACLGTTARRFQHEVDSADSLSTWPGDKASATSPA